MKAGLRTTIDRVLAVGCALVAIGYVSRLILEDFRWARLAMLCVFGSCAWYFWARNARSTKEHGERKAESFGPWLRDRSFREQVSELFAQRARQIEEDRVREPDWDEVVREALAGDPDEEDDVWLARARVRAGGDRATRAIERALRREGVREDRAACVFVLSELAERSSRAALACARAHAQSAVAGSLRREARKYLASSADGEKDLEILASSLACDDARAVAGAIRRRFADGETDPAGDALFEILDRARAAQETEHAECSIVRAMLAIDPDRCGAAVLPGGAWPREARRRNAIVAAYRRGMRRLPESSLTALVEDTRALLQGELDRSTAYDVASRLSVLQWMQHEDLPALLARALESPSMDLRAMAMDVKLESVGLAEWSQRLYAMWRKGSIEDAPYNDEQRIAIAAHDIIRGVQNGGLCNLYANGAQRCRFAYRQLAYRAVGASKLAHVIERADAIFGPDGPPEEQEAREDRVGELFDEMDDSPLFFEFCEHDSEALYLTSCYVLEHRDRILERLPDLAAR